MSVFPSHHFKYVLPLPYSAPVPFTIQIALVCFLMHFCAAVYVISVPPPLYLQSFAYPPCVVPFFHLLFLLTHSVHSYFSPYFLSIHLSIQSISCSPLSHQFCLQLYPALPVSFSFPSSTLSPLILSVIQERPPNCCMTCSTRSPLRLS